MTFFSPLTVKRFRSFRRIRRAWWSLVGLGVIFVFCMLADVVCPCDPRAVVDTATLHDAQQHPERYRDLLVRVAGYSDYFNDMTPQLQNEIIARTENEAF